MSLRVGYVLLALREKSLVEITRVSSDSSIFVAIAEYWRTGKGIGEYFLFQVGPGYASVLFGLNLLFGEGTLAPCIVNIILGAAASLIIYLLALQLIESKPISFAAGFLLAISTTSLAMSSSLLSDQPFFTIQAASILFFVTGLKRGERKWFILSGVTVVAAAYIRSINQFWPLIFVLLALASPLTGQFKTRSALLKRAFWTAGILFVSIMILATFNYTKYGLFVFGGNGVAAARNYWAALSVAQNTDGIDIFQVREKWSLEDAEYYGHRPPTVAEEYSRKRQHIIELFKEHPDWMMGTYLDILLGNTRGKSHFSEMQLPALKGLWRFAHKLGGKWMNETIFYFSLLGVLLLLVDRNRLAAVVLGGTYVYFTLITGFSFWQGSRLHFPAEMAGSILLVYALVRTSVILSRLVKYPFIRENRPGLLSIIVTEDSK